MNVFYVEKSMFYEFNVYKEYVSVQILQNIWLRIYKVVQIWPGRFVCKQVTVCPGHIWTTLYNGIILNKNVSNSTILFP